MTAIQYTFKNLNLCFQYLFLLTNCDDARTPESLDKNTLGERSFEAELAFVHQDPKNKNLNCTCVHRDGLSLPVTYTYIQLDSKVTYLPDLW